MKTGKKEMKAWLVSSRPAFMVQGMRAELGCHIHQVLGQDLFPVGRSVQLQLRAQEEEHQDDSAR